ncbi:MAG: type II toxin-antitoxin system RelE/ParE family toxin [Acidobacteria bacterium]|nr:type II toxin-antitoxin system RelE/ParE family toxin [Acidobacteriota bacterium]
MAWRVEISRTAEKQIKKLDRQVRTDLVRYLRERVVGATNPRSFGKPLRGEKKGLWRYRVGDYRIICDIRDSDETAVVLALGHRKHIYR